jgi:hypothetical protein
MRCDAKIRPFWPVNDTELQCEVAVIERLRGGTAEHHFEHWAVIRDHAFPGSRTEITWQEYDRRTFHGDWVPCLTSSVKCMLPAEHPGGHAV